MFELPLRTLVVYRLPICQIFDGTSNTVHRSLGMVRLHVIPFQIFGFIKLWQQHENEARSKLCEHAIRPSIYFINRNVDFLQHVFNYLAEACKSCNTGIIRGFTYNGYRVFVEHCFWPIITAGRKDTETRMYKVCTLDFVLGQIFVIFTIVAFPSGR